MDGGRTQLRDRMVRDAIVELLRGTCGLIGHVTVEGDRVRVELALPPEWSPFANSLTTDVQRRVQALPEVTVTEIVVTTTGTDEQTNTRNGRGTDG